MPMGYEIDAANGVARVTMTGHLTAEDFHAYMQATLEDPAFRPTLRRLVIVDIDSFPSGPEVQEIARETRSRLNGKPVRFAIVATAPLAVGMANMLFLQVGLDDRFAIFRDEPSARAWLAA